MRKFCTIIVTIIFSYLWSHTSTTCDVLEVLKRWDNVAEEYGDNMEITYNVPYLLRKSHNTARILRTRIYISHENFGANTAVTLLDV